jgi:hypothetical protein
LKVSHTNFFKVAAIATDAELPVEHQIDAFLGMSFLAYFDVVLDFAHDRVVLRQNDFFRKRNSVVKP